MTVCDSVSPKVGNDCSEGDVNDYYDIIVAQVAAMFVLPCDGRGGSLGEEGRATSPLLHLGQRLLQTTLIKPTSNHREFILCLFYRRGGQLLKPGAN